VNFVQASIARRCLQKSRDLVGLLAPSLTLV
jgi:hypothetical protein